MEKIRIAGVVNDSITDGPGLRLAVFTQGCPHRCPGCHNPQTHALSGGREASVEEIIALMERNPLICGITLTGGEPFLQPDACGVLAQSARQRGLSVIVYSGYLWEELAEQGAKARNLLSLCDWLVDGPFDAALQSLELEFKGSANQRIIHVPQSLERGAPVVFGRFPEDA